ncbi:MAG: RnfABCDGE type electron transport complex subunit G [Bacteroidales bacterium]|jgi:electron transport complex protein RnfG|nr:RnfABCDGE type electron transport complex subunit G [Bacteroidales bacterium]
MAKKKNSLFNMTSTLFIISAVAAFALAGVYSLTKGPIEQSEKKKIETAIKEVIPEFETLVQGQVKCADSDDSLTVYYGVKGTDTTGIAVESFTKNGFSGLITMMVGFLPDGTINNTKVLTHAETPGLGTKMMEDKFKNQFMQKNPSSYQLAVKKDGGDVDAITASTITSRAFCDAVSRAHQSIWKGGQE